MLPALLVLQIVMLALLGWLLLRKPAAFTAAEAAPDPRLLQLLAADLPAQFTRGEAHSQALERHLRDELAQLRAEHAAEAGRSRTAAESGSAALRAEVISSIGKLGDTLHTGLDRFRGDNKGDAAELRRFVDAQLAALTQRFGSFTTDTLQHHTQSRDALHTRLNALHLAQTEHQEKLRGTVEARLDAMNQTNEKKLEEMRTTVDEKLQKTLNERLTQSYGQVVEQLGVVQNGLGEMKELAAGVGDLKKVLTNVKARGIVGEFQLGQQLEQMFSPEQYAKNVNIKPDTKERVEYALKFPNGPASTVLLAIDSKWPREDWERLEQAYETGTADEISSAGKAFERAIRAEGKTICEKYIDPPTTLPHAIMFLPIEGLYAEVVRRPGLQSELQQQCRVTIAGPSTFMAILTSFQMGFHTLALEKKGDEVWKVLGRAKTEFENFGGLMERVEKQVGTVQNTLRDIRGKNTTITRALKGVSALQTGTPVTAPSLADTMLPLLAAEAEE